MSNQNIVVKSNDLIEARYKLSLNEQRLVIFLISIIQPEDDDFRDYELRISEFAVMLLPTKALACLIPFLLASVAVYVLLSPRFHDEDQPARMPPHKVFALLGLVLGFYDGFFGPGTGSFWAVGLVSLAGYGLTRATGYTKVMNCSSNVASLAVFLIGGKVLFLPALTMAVGQAVGSWIGSHMALRNGAKLIRPILGSMSILLAVWLVWRLVR